MQLRLHNAILSTILATTWVHQSSARLEATKDSRALMTPMSSSSDDNDADWCIVHTNRNTGSFSIMSEANPADGTDAGVTNIDIKQLLIKAGAIPDDPNVKSDPMYVNVFPKQVGNNPTPGGSSIFIADRGLKGIVTIDPTGVMPPKLIQLDANKCSGGFHSWANEEYHANVCTGTNSIVLLKLSDMSLSYVSLGESDGTDITNEFCVPHDVVVNKANEVFMTNFSDGSGKLCQNQLIRFSADDAHTKAMNDEENCVKADEVKRFKAINIGENCATGTNSCTAASGLDAHVGSPDLDASFLYLPIQKGDGALNGPGFGRLAVYRTDDLSFSSEQAVDLAHGICFAADDSKVLVTSIGLGKVVEFEAVDDDGILGSPGITGMVPDEVKRQKGGSAHNIIKTPKGDVFATHSHPPPADVSSWALTHFDNDLHLVGKAGYHVAGLPPVPTVNKFNNKDRLKFNKPDKLPDSNPFGITKYLGLINMDQFDGALVMQY